MKNILKAINDFLVEYSFTPYVCIVTFLILPVFIFEPARENIKKDCTTQSFLIDDKDTVTIKKCANSTSIIYKGKTYESR